MQKRPPKCENRTPFNVLSLFPRFPGTPKRLPNWTPKLQNVRKLHSQKSDNKPTPEMSSTTQTKFQHGLTFRGRNNPKKIKNEEKSKLAPETSRCPKSIHKKSKRHPKGFQILSIWIPMESKSQRHNAKDCKEPCTLTELPSRKTS